MSENKNALNPDILLQLEKEKKLMKKKKKLEKEKKRGREMGLG